MASYLQSNGSGSTNFYANHAGLRSWARILQDSFLSSETPQDAAMPDLVCKVCEPDPAKRLTAHEVVLRIMQVPAPPLYHGLCCNKERWAKGSGSMQWPQGVHDIQATDEDEITIGSSLFGEPYSIGNLANYSVPTVEEAEMTVQAILNQPPKSTYHILEDFTVHNDIASIEDLPRRAVDGSEQAEDFHSSAPILSGSHGEGELHPASLWSCQATLVPEETGENKRAVGRFGPPVTFDLLSPADALSAKPGRPPSTASHASVSSSQATLAPEETLESNKVVGKSASPRVAKQQSHAASSFPICRRLLSIDPNALPCDWPNCKPPQGLAFVLFSGIQALQEHLRDSHQVHEYGWTRLFDDRHSRPAELWTLDPETGALIVHESSRRTTARRTGEDERAVRFGDLPKERRPRVSDRQTPRPKSNGSVYPVNAELPIAPILQGSGQKYEIKVPGVPPTSFVPSYILASKNRFSQLELLQRKFSGDTLKPLFVYGTLMFPSILNALSRSFIHSTEGIYSAAQGRRLRTDAKDWSRINESILKTTECMTPAVLKGYKRFGLKRLTLAYINGALGEPDSEVQGFLIFGLSTDALACVKHLYEDGGPRHYFNEVSSRKKLWRKPEMTRQDVTVSICSTGHERIDVEAVSFVNKERRLEADMRPWDINEFLRSRSFNCLTSTDLDGKERTKEWMKEEQEIADTIGTQLVLVGDYLVQGVLDNDAEGLIALLGNGYNVDSPSARFGTALQAAAYKGNEQMMRVLLSSGASVDAEGGEYGSALVAAVAQSHLEAVKLLLQEDANLFVPGGRYVSALYQAVDFDNVDIAHVLLEKGAWLTTNYNELQDLAAERNNPDMCRELEVYDVREKRRSENLHGVSLGPVESHTSRRDRMELQSTQYKEMGAACLWEAVKLHGTPGKWTGIKGVRLMRVALQNGMDETIIERIRPHIQSFPKIQSFFAGAVGEKLGGRLKPVKHTDAESEESRVREIADEAQLSRRNSQLVAAINHVGSVAIPDEVKVWSRVSRLP